MMNNNDSADLHPDHVRKILIATAVMWSVFHIILIIKIIIEVNYVLLLILIAPIIVNIWCILRIIKFYKNK